MAERPEQVDGHPYMLGSDYTADGGLSNDGRFAYAYDAEDRLASATSLAPTGGAVRVRNEYDWRSRRVVKCVDRYDADAEAWRPAERHDFAWDNWNIVHETVSTFAGAATNVTGVQYFWGPDLSNSIQGAGGVGGFTLLFSNENMYDDWNTTVEHIRKDDKFYSHTKGKCEVLEIQYGDRGVSPIRIRFE